MHRTELVEVPELRMPNNRLTPDAAATIPAIKAGVEALGGKFHAWSALRTYDEQAGLRARFEALKAWKEAMTAARGPKPPYQAYACKPGGSWHEAGRAVDFAVFDLVDGKRVSALGFSGDPELHLETFWEIVKPLGWVPIINKPTLNLEECWHFEFRGPWSHAVEEVGYRTAVKAAIVDVGNYGGPAPDLEVMFIQAQLLRLGQYNIDDIDGVMGDETEAALDALGVPRDSGAVEILKGL